MLEAAVITPRSRGFGGGLPCHALPDRVQVLGCVDVAGIDLCVKTRHRCFSIRLVETRTNYKPAACRIVCEVVSSPSRIAMSTTGDLRGHVAPDSRAPRAFCRSSTASASLCALARAAPRAT